MKERKKRKKEGLYWLYKVPCSPNQFKDEVDRSHADEVRKVMIREAWKPDVR
jgi:hypothetical protein